MDETRTCPGRKDKELTVKRRQESTLYNPANKTETPSTEKTNTHQVKNSITLLEALGESDRPEILECTEAMSFRVNLIRKRVNEKWVIRSA
ncbi:hypothetical protein L1987_07658 [Smallanthus sonchifolius]|uniref:Uncharacterized protein n=1 Tax=Smallanthus sonchifolius TaxID=185202 RepID=A0ACB9K107_9ASTR|nr:hypothetical protein L1987_07658 [Smallanthus sonchifolius]